MEERIKELEKELETNERVSINILESFRLEKIKTIKLEKQNEELKALNKILFGMLSDKNDK